MGHDTKAWQADDWLVLSDAEPGTTIPGETGRWIASPAAVEVRR